MSPILLLLQPILALAAAGGGDYKPYQPAPTTFPSAPTFVLIAYSAIWIVLLLFLVSIWYRQRDVEKELRALQRRLEP